MTGGGSGFATGGDWPEIDTTIAHAGRIYDHFLGGVDNFAVDRAAAEHAAAVHPGGIETVRASVRSNRAFLVRGVRWLAAQGVRQFLDIGSGIPNRDNVHAVAQQAASGTRVVYVDNDPVVLAHAHELLCDDNGHGRVRYLADDIRAPASILERAQATLDLAEPVGVMLLGVLHFLPDTADGDDPYRIVSQLTEAVAPGSHLMVSHLARDIHPTEMVEVERRFNESTAETWALRTRDQVRGFFQRSDLELVEGDVVQIDQWRPDDDPGPVLPPEGRTNPLWAGVGRKP